MIFPMLYPCRCRTLQFLDKMGVLTTEERKLIVNSWELVKPNMQRHGAQFFILLFSEMPHLQIKHFSQMDVNDLFRLTGHGLKVFRGVNGFVNAVNTDNDDQLVKRIQRITRTHFDRGIIEKEDFQVK